MKLTKNLSPVPIAFYGDSCVTFDYARDELARMLNKAGVSFEHDVVYSPKISRTYAITIGTLDDGGVDLSLLETTLHDGYIIKTLESGVELAANSAKGILNAVYDFMERCGYVYLFPGDDGEWAPKEPSEPLIGVFVENPRFPYRGVFREETSATPDYTSEEWFDFYAKLRFNAVVLDKIE